MTATVLFIRHASHGLLGRALCGRSEGVRLSAEGRNEAQGLARRLAGCTLGAVYASPQTRTRETAELLAQTPIEIDARLDEVEFGEWKGRAFDELAPDARWRRWNEDRGRARAPGGESLIDVQLRVADFLRFVAGRHAGAMVAAVSHADVIKAALSFALGLPLHFYDRFEVAPASISAVAAGDWGLKVLSLNEGVR